VAGAMQECAVELGPTARRDVDEDRSLWLVHPAISVYRIAFAIRVTALIVTRAERPPCPLRPDWHAGLGGTTTLRPSLVLGRLLVVHCYRTSGYTERII
jgi:hypothetical protein